MSNFDFQSIQLNEVGDGFVQLMDAMQRIGWRHIYTNYEKVEDGSANMTSVLLCRERYDPEFNPEVYVCLNQAEREQYLKTHLPIAHNDTSA